MRQLRMFGGRRLAAGSFAMRYRFWGRMRCREAQYIADRPRLIKLVVPLLLGPNPDDDANDG
jgi:hypothetical protein